MAKDRNARSQAPDASQYGNPTKQQMKKIRRKEREGKTVKSAEDYLRAREEEDRRAERNREDRLIKVPQPELVPFDVQARQVHDREPDLIDQLERGDTVRARQTDHLYRARAIYFNDWDKNHTFNRKYTQCRMLLAVIIRRLNRGDQMTVLEIEYLRACLERKRKVAGVFDAREKFLRDWCDFKEEFYVFKETEIKRFKKFTKDLRAALPQIEAPKLPSSTGFSQNAPQSAFTSTIGGLAPSKAEPLEGPTGSDFLTSGSRKPVQFNKLPALSKPYKHPGLPEIPTKNAYTLRVQTVDDDDWSDDEDDGGVEDEDEDMETEDMPGVARTMGEIHKEWNDLNISNEVSREKSARIAKLAEEMKVTLDERFLEEALDKANMLGD